MAHIATMKSLTMLNVEDTTIGDAGLRRIVTLPALMDLRLSGSQVSGTGLGSLKFLASNLEAVHRRRGHQRRVAFSPEVAPEAVQSDDSEVAGV